MRIAFYADGYSDKVAANRLRMLQPIALLRARGVDASVFDPAAGLSAYQGVIISRAHDRAALAFAAAAQALGHVIAYDVCDNLFHGYRSWHDRHRRPRFAAMLRGADFVTTPTATLARLLNAEVPDARAKFVVIPDALEERAALAAPPSLAPLAAFLARHAGALHCVWFGSSTKNLAGLPHLDAAIGQLARFGRHQPVTLTVIGDKPWQYWLAQRRWPIPSFHHGFATADFQAALALHRVAVIPVARNPYTVAKSINRPATAMRAGLGVVADTIESYEELRRFIRLDDWQAGLAYYAEVSPAECPRLAAGRDHLEANYGANAIAGHWQRLIATMAAKTPAL